MPSFKYKTNKKITVDDKSIVTLDNRHKEMQLHFSNVTNIIIPNLLKMEEVWDINQRMEFQINYYSIH